MDDRCARETVQAEHRIGAETKLRGDPADGVARADDIGFGCWRDGLPDGRGRGARTGAQVSIAGREGVASVVGFGGGGRGAAEGHGDRAEYRKRQDRETGALCRGGLWLWL